MVPDDGKNPMNAFWHNLKLDYLRSRQPKNHRGHQPWLLTEKGLRRYAGYGGGRVQ